MPSWDLVSEIQWGSQHSKGKLLKFSVYKLCIAATVYAVWEERNSRMFRQHGMDHSALVKCIWDEIKAGVSSWRNVPVSAENQDCCAALGLNPAIFAKASCA